MTRLHHQCIRPTSRSWNANTIMSTMKLIDEPFSYSVVNPVPFLRADSSRITSDRYLHSWRHYVIRSDSKYYCRQLLYTTFANPESLLVLGRRSFRNFINFIP